MNLELLPLKDLKKTLAHVDGEIIMRQSLIVYWTGFAPSLANKMRVKYKGGTEEKMLRADELEEEAFNTAKTHCERLRELIDTRYIVLTKIYELEAK